MLNSSLGSGVMLIGNRGKRRKHHEVWINTVSEGRRGGTGFSGAGRTCSGQV